MINAGEFIYIVLIIFHVNSVIGDGCDGSTILIRNSERVGKVKSVCYMLEMRDGVHLHTFVDFPAVNQFQNLTSVIDRSPYGATATELIADIYLEFGFVAVRQDMRGTHESEGKFTLWHNAANDSYDTMKWISEQPWSNGRVLTVGASADGIASLLDPLDQPSWLKAQMIIFATSKARPMVYPGGAYRYQLIEKWLNRTVPSQAAGLIKLVRENEGPTAWWTPVEATMKAYAKVNFPSVMWGGWYDIFLNGNLAAFDGYQYHCDPAFRGQSKIVIDPLGHCQKAAKFFPKNLIDGRVVLPLLMSIDLFKEVKKTPENVKAVTFYVMGAFNDTTAPGSYWTTLDEFPSYKEMKWYLQADKTLSLAPPSSSSANASSYVYDPAHPVPTVGGNNLETTCGPLDQSGVEQRSDVLVFTSNPLNAAVAVTGPLTVRLYVSSDRKDTDFTAKLTDVSPDGTSNLIQDGIVRMRWRDFDSKEPQLMTPGDVYGIDVSLWNTSFIFAPHHRIRVSISSSNFPRFEPNPNTGIPLAQPQAPPLNATNTVFHSSEYASHLVLPLVTMAQLPEAHDIF